MPRRSDRSPSPDPSLLILASLASGSKHGWAIVEDVERFAGIRLGPGTLYGALARLEQRKLIEPIETDDRRRPYRLTGLGRNVLETELGSMQRLAETGLSRLGNPAAEASA